jgi:hypothetical protein
MTTAFGFGMFGYNILCFVLAALLVYYCINRFL